LLVCGCFEGSARGSSACGRAGVFFAVARRADTRARPSLVGLGPVFEGRSSAGLVALAAAFVALVADFAVDFVLAFEDFTGSVVARFFEEVTRGAVFVARSFAGDSFAAAFFGLLADALRLDADLGVGFGSCAVAAPSRGEGTELRASTESCAVRLARIGSLTWVTRRDGSGGGTSLGGGRYARASSPSKDPRCSTGVRSGRGIGSQPLVNHSSAVSPKSAKTCAPSPARRRATSVWMRCRSSRIFRPRGGAGG
jgi:hypothetical protein